MRVGEEAQLPASLVVREESLTALGFADDDERLVFDLLQTASGIGPRLAQAMLAVHTPDDLRRAVATEDLVALTRVPGVGKKSAQRIVVELADKLGPASSQPHAAGALVRRPWRPHPRRLAGPLAAALMGLGWTGREADTAIGQVSPLVGDGVDAADVSALLKAALRTLAPS